MNKKRLLIIVTIVVLLIIVLCFSGVIPKQIARIYGTNYIKDNFPEMQLEYVNIEWNKYYGKLSKRTYRIVKPVYDNGYVDIYSNEFEIK